MRLDSLIPVFVESAPPALEDGKLYVSMTYASVLHKCCCGCGNEVTTPLSPVDWQLTFDGETISLHPSIGNWGLPCGSHYWIEKNKVLWAGAWSERRVELSRAADRAARRTRFEGRGDPVDTVPAGGSTNVDPKWPAWRRLWRWCARLFG